MPKQLKKAKKPFYWFVIIAFINSFVLGAVFNFNFIVKLPKISIHYEKGQVDIQSPQAKADVATTTVTVQNAPPAFTVDPAESPESPWLPALVGAERTRSAWPLSAAGKSRCRRAAL